MSEDPNEKELSEDDVNGEEVKEEAKEATPPPMDLEVEEIEVEQVAADEGPGGDFSGTSEAASALLGKGKMSEKDDKTFGMLAHLLGGLTSFVGPMVIWLIKKDESPFVEDQGKEALNFQITVLIALVASMILSAVPFLGCVAMLLSPAIGVAGLVFAILACLKANEGTAYRYPYALRLIK